MHVKSALSAIGIQRVVWLTFVHLFEVENDSFLPDSRYIIYTMNNDYIRYSEIAERAIFFEMAILSTKTRYFS